jgi:hypothetical protein
MIRYEILAPGWIVPFLGMVITASPLTGETPPRAASQRMKAESLVAAALRAEVSGDQQRRDACLEGALREVPDLATARWHRGNVSPRRCWISHVLRWSSQGIGA